MLQHAIVTSGASSKNLATPDTHRPWLPYIGDRVRSLDVPQELYAYCKSGGDYESLFSVMFLLFLNYICMCTDWYTT